MTTPILKVTGINHVVLHVRDMERSMTFYTEVLGFENRRETGGPPQKMNFLRCGEQGLDLFEVEGDVHGGEEMNHVALSVTAGDIDTVIDALVEAGIEVSPRTRRNTVFIADPDGHRIEMLPIPSTANLVEEQAARVSG